MIDGVQSEREILSTAEFIAGSKQVLQYLLVKREIPEENIKQYWKPELLPQEVAASLDPFWCDLFEGVETEQELRKIFHERQTSSTRLHHLVNALVVDLQKNEYCHIWIEIDASIQQLARNAMRQVLRQK